MIALHLSKSICRIGVWVFAVDLTMASIAEQHHIGIVICQYRRQIFVPSGALHAICDNMGDIALVRTKIAGHQMANQWFVAVFKLAPSGRLCPYDPPGFLTQVSSSVLAHISSSMHTPKRPVSMNSFLYLAG